MRVIAGKFRSRRLKAVPGLAVRPTPDRLREALFNVLAPRIQGTVFVDAYAGTGAVGIEALSRGAKRVIFIERSTAALAVLRENISSLGVQDDSIVIRGGVSALLGRETADIVFIDPPYDRPQEYDEALRTISETGGELAIAQHASRLPLESRYGVLERTRVLRQGDNSLSFYERAEDPPASMM